MTSIGKFMVAGASASQESTFALANMNFDFSIIKLEAPIEYSGLGSTLSTKRKREAERGSAHITARKLGALFADDLPPTPHLSQAYGLRISEIAENPKYNPRGSAAHGPFVEHVGADGTSIWAAATSGRGAMEVHLLACLLARMWSGPEATSIWSVLVEERRALLQDRLNKHEFHIGMITACQITIDREKLAEWDASARAWLRSSDTAMKTQQTQLMLIINNLNVPMPSKPTVYQDVMDAWKASMILLDKLVSGVPQKVQSAEPLLGLCAWHIYPDLCALGATTTLVEQHDSLVKKGGLVTLGLFNARPESDMAISWSMPLAHLRYYGKAVMSHGTFGAHKSRVSFNQILQAAIGSMLSTWGSQYSNLDDVFHFLVAFEKLVQSEDQERKQKDWLTLFSEQAKAYIEASPREQNEIALYVALGQRRFGSFLAKSRAHPSPCFGLSRLEFFLKYQEPEQRIAPLRQGAQTSNDESHVAFIRCVHTTGHEIGMIEYATLVPQLIPGTTQRRHRRWLDLLRDRTQYDPESPKSSEGFSLGFAESLFEEKFTPSLEHENAVIERSIAIMQLFDEPCGFINGPTVFEVRPKSALKTETIFWSDKGAPRSLEYLIERASSSGSRNADAMEAIKGLWQIGHLDHEYKGMDFCVSFGNPDEVAVYRPVGLNSLRLNHELPITFVTQSTASRGFDSAKFCIYWRNKIKGPQAEYFTSLAALARVYEVYKNLPEAEVNLNILSAPFRSTEWATAAMRDSQSPLTRAGAFACVALFDTGYLDIASKNFDKVIAISSGNAIYASEILFRDPWHPSTSALRHVTGNVGKPGLALLISPEDTILREPDLETWQLINHAKYDGKCENNFAATSLHLSTTGYEQPLDLGRHGGRDRETIYVETVVSVHDNGKWVADLNLLKFAGKSRKSKEGTSVFGYLPACCEHDAVATNDTSAFTNLTSIDNWDEFLDRPRSAGIVRARGNWVARLALAATPLAGDHRLFLANKDVCWACVRNMALSRSFDMLIIIC